LALLLKGTTAQAFSIPSESMEPQLLVGDRVLVSRTSYRLHDPNRGDIVVFPSPIADPDDDSWAIGIWHDALETVALRDPGDDELIKRIVGLPGETIEGRDGQVLIDGRLLLEPYLPAQVTTGDFGPVKIPAGRVFVMGDNRGDSHDSRFSDIGTIDVDTIVGRAVGRIWPPTRTAFL
jgi:signal peptidase I